MKPAAVLAECRPLFRRGLDALAELPAGLAPNAVVVGAESVASITALIYLEA